MGREMRRHEHLGALWRRRSDPTVCHGPRAHARPRPHLRRGDRARAARVPRAHRLGPARHRLERRRVGGGPRHRVVDGRPRDAHAPGRHAHRPRPRPRARDRGDDPRAEPLDRPLRARGDPRPEPDHERPQGRVRPPSADDQPDRGDARPVVPVGHSATAAAFYAAAALVLGRTPAGARPGAARGRCGVHRGARRRDARDARRPLADRCDRRPPAGLGLVRGRRDRLRRPPAPLRRDGGARDGRGQGQAAGVPARRRSRGRARRDRASA